MVRLNLGRQACYAAIRRKQIPSPAREPERNGRMSKEIDDYNEYREEIKMRLRLYRIGYTSVHHADGTFSHMEPPCPIMDNLSKQLHDSKDKEASRA